ncbi:MAG: hypothetical protein R3C18_11320 [Planctomycetaceae bacterium]
MDDVNPFAPPRQLSLRSRDRLRMLARRFLMGIVLFAVYTLSYGPWVAVGSRYYIPGGHFIHHVIYAPLHFLSSHIPPYRYITMELFWWGYGPV